MLFQRLFTSPFIISTIDVKVHKPQFALAMLGLATTLSVTAVQYQTSLQPKTKPEGFEFEQKHSIRPGENRDTLFVDHSPNFLAHLQKKE